MSPIIDLTGQRFGRLVVLEIAGRTSRRLVVWQCQCDCGTRTLATVSELRDGKKKSCGCLKRERLIARSTKHGHAPRHESGKRHPLYERWCGMLQRCSNPKHHKYRLYGARGVTVCERWRTDFSAFLADVGQPPSPIHSLDRIDPDGNYEPANVRWATPQQQTDNRRDRREEMLNARTR